MHIYVYYFNEQIKRERERERVIRNSLPNLKLKLMDIVGYSYRGSSSHAFHNMFRNNVHKPIYL
jgi:hypothetical protein